MCSNREPPYVGQFRSGIAPADVVDAFKDVASALEDRDRLINEARGEYNAAIPRAAAKPSGRGKKRWALPSRA